MLIFNILDLFHNFHIQKIKKRADVFEGFSACIIRHYFISTS